MVGEDRIDNFGYFARGNTLFRNKGDGTFEDASLEAGLALEREAFSYCFSLPDAKEGISAFLEKRKPVFEK